MKAPEYLLAMDERELIKYELYLEDRLYRMRKYPKFRMVFAHMKDRWVQLLHHVQQRRDQLNLKKVSV